MPINFNYSPFEEDIIIAGTKGTGKTERAKKILSEIRSLPYWVHDFQRDKFTNYGKVCRTIDELEPGTQCIFQPKINDYANFLAFCRKVHFEVAEKGGNLVYLIDELHQWIKNKQVAIPELATLVLSDRNKGISGIFVTSNHTTVPNWIIDNASHFFAYRVNLASRLEWLEDNIGEESWLLFPQDKRKKLQEDPRIIKKHGFVYRNQFEDSAQVEIGED